MLEETVPQAAAYVEEPIGPNDTPGAPETPLAAAVRDAQDRMDTYRPVIDHLALAVRIADSPEGVDRTTIPLTLALGPTKLKELGALLRLSPFLKADVLSVLAMYRAEREELQRYHRAHEMQATGMLHRSLVATPESLDSINGLFRWMQVIRERFAEHRAVYDLLDPNSFDETREIVIPRAVPTELSDVFGFPKPGRPQTAPLPAPEPTGWQVFWKRLRARFDRSTPGGGTPAREDERDLRNPEHVMELMSVPQLTLELGLDLVKLVDPVFRGDLMDRVIPMRMDVCLDTGFVVPGIQFKDNMTLPENGYRVFVRGTIVARGHVMRGLAAAVQTQVVEDEAPPPGLSFTDPASGRPAWWVPPHLAPKLREAGYNVYDANGVILRHLEETLRDNSCDVLSMDEVQIMINKLRDRAPVAVKHVFEDRHFDLAEFHQILRALLRERVPIRDLGTIVERLGHLLVQPHGDLGAGPNGPLITVHLNPSDQSFDKQLERIERATPRGQMPTDTAGLIEALRQALAREICARLADHQDALDVVSLSSDLELTLIDAIVSGREARALALSPAMGERVLGMITRTCRHLDTPIILCDPKLRPALKRFTAHALPRLHVLSHAELHPQFQVRTVATIGWERGMSSRD